jgi:hypothetical protein
MGSGVDPSDLFPWSQCRQTFKINLYGNFKVHICDCDVRAACNHEQLTLQNTHSARGTQREFLFISF